MSTVVVLLHPFCIDFGDVPGKDQRNVVRGVLVFQLPSQGTCHVALSEDHGDWTGLRCTALDSEMDLHLFPGV